MGRAIGGWPSFGVHDSFLESVHELTVLPTAVLPDCMLLAFDLKGRPVKELLGQPETWSLKAPSLGSRCHRWSMSIYALPPRRALVVLAAKPATGGNEKRPTSSLRLRRSLSAAGPLDRRLDVVALTYRLDERAGRLGHFPTTNRLKIAAKRTTQEEERHVPTRVDYRRDTPLVRKSHGAALGTTRS